MSDTHQRRGRAARRAAPPARVVNYRGLRHPFQPQKVLSDDMVATIHDMALKVLEELGLRILLPEARQIFAAAGARVNETSEMVFVGRDIIADALVTAPKSIRLRAANPARELTYEDGALIFSPAGGCPNATDADRGRRPGDLATFEETLKLHQSFDVIHKLGPSAEPQDIPAHLRHYAMMKGQMSLCDKPMFVYARGRAQVAECFEMIQLGYGLSGDAHHITAPAEDGNGGYRSMQAAIKRAGIAPADIGYVNAHGTSTPLGDEIELGAVTRLMGDHAADLVMSSTKSAIGHLLGAAGAVEAIFTMLAMRDGICPPTINLDNPSVETAINLAPNKAVKKDIEFALSNSFGFGGTNASLIFRKLQ